MGSICCRIGRESVGRRATGGSSRSPRLDSPGVRRSARSRDGMRSNSRALDKRALATGSGARPVERGCRGAWPPDDAESQRRRARETAGPLAAPRARFLALLDALAEAPPGGVVLQRVAQRPQEVELTAFAPDSQTAARWLKHLETVRDVQTVEVVEMKRPVLPAARSKPGKAPGCRERLRIHRARAMDRRNVAQASAQGGLGFLQSGVRTNEHARDESPDAA